MTCNCDIIVERSRGTNIVHTRPQRCQEAKARHCMLIALAPDFAWSLTSRRILGSSSSMATVAPASLDGTRTCRGGKARNIIKSKGPLFATQDCACKERNPTSPQTGLCIQEVVQNLPSQIPIRGNSTPKQGVKTPFSRARVPHACVVVTENIAKFDSTP